MRRCQWSAHLVFPSLLRSMQKVAPLGHCHPAIVQNGPTITSLQDLQTLTVLSLLKRSAPGRSFCEAAMAHDTFHTCENNKDDKHDAFHTCKNDKDDKHAAFHTCGNVKNSKTAAAIETESATRASLNQAQSTAMCNILMSGIWDSKTQALLEPFVKSLSTSLVARVLNCLTNVDTAKRFFHWAGQQVSYKHNTYVYNALLMKLGLAKDFVAMWELLDEMRREGCAATNSTFSIIIQYYGKAGLLEECWRTINKATSFGVKPDAHMYTALLGVLFDAGKVDKAKQLLGRMIHYNTTLDMRSWSTVIHGLCKNRKLQDAQVCLDQMLKHGCTPNVFIYNAMILGFSETNCPEKALSVFDTMRERGCKPDVYTYNAVIGLYCSLDKFIEADDLFSNMADAGCEPNQVTYNTLLSGLLKRGKSMEADEFFKIMQRGRWVDQASYRIYTVHLGRSGDIKKLISLSKEMFSRYGNCNVQVCNAILQRYCDDGDLSKAIHYFNEDLVRLTAPDEFSYALMINALCKSGGFDAARSLLLRMDEGGYKPTDHNYNPLIIGLCKNSREDEALQLFKEMKEKGIEPSPASCEHLLRVLSDAGLVDAAIMLCEHITDRCLAVKDFTILLFVRCLNKLNKLEEAKILVSAMQHRGCLPKCRRSKRALQAMLSGNIDEVENFFRNPQGREIPNAISYALRIQGCCKKDKMDEAKMLLAEMEEVGCEPNASCYGPIIAGLGRVGRLKESFELFEEMVGRGVNSSSVASNLMKRLCEAEMVEEILELGKHITAKGLTVQRSSIGFLLEGGSKSDRLQELKQLLHELRENNCLVPSAAIFPRVSECPSTIEDLAN